MKEQKLATERCDEIIKSLDLREGETARAAAGCVVIEAGESSHTQELEGGVVEIIAGPTRQALEAALSDPASGTLPDGPLKEMVVGLAAHMEYRDSRAPESENG